MSLFTTPPKGISYDKPGQLTPAQVKEFFDEGFLVIEDFFDKSLLDAAREDINELVDDLAHKLYEAGKIKDLYADYGLFKRLTKLEQDFPGANIILHKTGKLPPSFRSIWSHEKSLNIAEQILGTADIVGNPVWNLRCKTPNNEATVVPWHQDSAYMDETDCKKLVFSAWIPLLDTNASNGGMECVRRSHRTGKVAKHTCCYGGTWYVMLDDEEMGNTLECDPEKDSVICHVPYGGVLFFNNMIPHRSLANTSDDVRWSLDMRYNRADVPAGLWGLKEGVRLRSSTDPNIKIGWEAFESVDRNDKQFEAVNVKPDELDTTVHGPWMKRWELVHTNRHTEALDQA